MKDKTAELLRLFRQNQGYLRTGQLREANIHPYHLQKLIRQGKVEKIRFGLYRLVEKRYDEWQTVQKAIPNGVFCMFSAWDFYNLTTYKPFEFHIAIDKKRKISLPKFPPIKLYYWENKILTLGQTTVKVNGCKIKIFDIERSVCDAVRFKNKIGKDIMFEVLKNYLQRRDRNLDKLLFYAKKLRILKLLKTYIEALQ